MATPRRTLTSLPSDVLHEILKLVLLDTPRSPQRAAVLRTCSLLSDLGLPLLYRIVDLTGMEERSTIITHWKRLFGVGGLFAKETKTGRRVAVGSFVRELRLAGAERCEEGPCEDFHVLPPDLPLCSTLHFDCTELFNSYFPPLSPIISQLPVTHLVVFREQLDTGEWFPTEGFAMYTLAHCLGIEPQPWENLETIIFRGCLWYDFICSNVERLSCSDLSFKVLVVDVHAGSAKTKVGDAVALFLEPKLREGERFLEGIERIEFRLRGRFASAIEQKFRIEVRRRVKRGLTSLERRLLPLFVSVGEDGKERSFGGLE